MKKKIFEKIDTKVLLSTLWIFAILNYLYTDVIGFYEPGLLAEVMTGAVGGMVLDSTFLFFGMILMKSLQFFQ